MKKIIPIIISLMMVLTVSFVQYPVYAGTVGVDFIREGMFDNATLGVGDWKYKGNISVINGEIFFHDKSTADNIVINYTKVECSQNVEKTLDINFDVNLKTFSENKKFGLAYGLENFIQKIGSPKSSYIYFEKVSGKYYLGINTYDENGNECIVLEKKQLFSDVNINNISVEVKILNDNSLKVLVDGVLFYASSVTTAVGRVEGLIGFGQTGSGDANVTNEIYVKLKEVKNLYYDTPSAPRETVLTFDNDEFNKNEWYVYNRRVNGSRGFVVENGHLFLDEVGETSMFATKRVYSNFKLIFDVYDAKNTVDKDGPFGASHALSISFGDGMNAPEENSSPATRSVYFTFDAGRDDNTGKRNRDTYAYVSYNGKGTEVIKTIPAKYGFFNEGFDPNTKVRICMTVIDGVFEVKMKLATEFEYTTIYAHYFPNFYSPSGCIRLMGHHNNFTRVKYNMGTNLKIDDLRLYNMDINPNVPEVEFASNKTKVIPDYQYVDTWSKTDLLDFTLGK